MDYLISFRDRMERARRLITDPELTAFFFVTLPEALPIAVIRRFIHWFHDFGIPVSGVIVNGLIDRSLLGENTPDFVRNRIEMQGRYLQEIEALFDGLVRGMTPSWRTKCAASPCWSASRAICSRTPAEPASSLVRLGFASQAPLERRRKGWGASPF
jgi:arsenite-transporting ATPase